MVTNVPYEHSRKHTAKRATETGASLSSLSLWHSRPIGNSSMRIASRRYPYRPLGRGSPRPTPARYVGLCGGDGPPPRLSGGYTRPAHVLGYSNAPSPRGGPTRAAGLWCARTESLGDGRRKVGVIARVSGADAIYGAGRARPLRGRAEVSLGSRLPPCPEGAGSGGERWAHTRYGARR